MDRIYDMTGSAIGGIVLEDQTVCDKIDSNGGSILIEPKNPKSSNSDKNMFDEKSELANIVPLEISKILKDDLKDEPNGCLIAETSKHKNGFISLKSLIIQFTNNRPMFAFAGELGISKDKILKPYLFLNKKIDKWMTDKTLRNTFFTNQIEGMLSFKEFFTLTNVFYGKITDNKKISVNDIPVMTFKDTDTGKLYNIDLFFEKFTDFSNCFTRVSQENMKRFKERN